MNMSPLIVPAPIRMPRVEPISRRLRRRARSTSGAGDRFSTARNPNTDTADTTKQSSVDGEVQPQSAPFENPRISGARISATSAVPSQSIDRDRFGSLDSVTVRRVTGTQHRGDGGVDPEQPLPAGGVDEQSADERAGRRADGRGRTPQGHRPHPFGRRRWPG